MANPHAGEVEVLVDGVPRTAKLTLGALAELEAALGDDTLIALVGRFEAGDVSSRDVLALLVAGLRGGGWPVTRARPPRRRDRGRPAGRRPRGRRSSSPGPSRGRHERPPSTGPRSFAPGLQTLGGLDTGRSSGP